MDIGKLFSQAWGLFVKDIGPLIVGALIAGIVPAIAATVVLIATLGATFATSTVSPSGDITSVSAAGWALFAVGMALVIVVAVLLSAPLYGGLVMGVVRRVRENRDMGYGDAFQGFSFFRPVVGVTVIVTAVMIGIFLVPVVLAIAAAAASSLLLGLLAALAGLAAFVAAVYLGTRWVYAVPLVVDQRMGAADALRESGMEVKRAGWWMTFLALTVMGIVVGIVGGVLGVVPFVGTVASLLLTPFSLTYIIAMYLQSRGEGVVIDRVLRQVVPATWPTDSVPGSAAYPPAPPTSGAVQPGQAGLGTPAPAAPAPIVPEAPPETAVTDAGQAGGDRLMTPPPAPQPPQPPAQTPQSASPPAAPEAGAAGQPEPPGR